MGKRLLYCRTVGGRQQKKKLWITIVLLPIVGNGSRIKWRLYNVHVQFVKSDYEVMYKEKRTIFYAVSS